MAARFYRSDSEQHECLILSDLHIDVSLFTRSFEDISPFIFELGREIIVLQKVVPASYKEMSPCVIPASLIYR